MTYRNYRRDYSPGMGLGRWYRRGYGRGLRRYSPNCDWFPDRPRGWWAVPEFQSQIADPDYVPPPSGVTWGPYGKPENLEEINYEISLLEKDIERLKKAIINLNSLKESLDES